MTEPEPTRTSPDRRIAGGLLLLLLVALSVLRSAVGTRLDSLTGDEPWHIVAGTAYARIWRLPSQPRAPAAGEALGRRGDAGRFPAAAGSAR